MNVKVGAVGVMFAAMAMSIHAEELQTFQTRFDQLRVGQTKREVISIIGREPDSESSTRTFGITKEVMRWQTAGRSYAVHLGGAASAGVENRVYGIRTCVGIIGNEC